MGHSIEQQSDLQTLCECIDGMQQELTALKAAKLAKILKSYPRAIKNKGKYVVLCEYGIPLNDHAIQAKIRDIHMLNNDVTDGSNLFSVCSNNDKNRKLYQSQGLDLWNALSAMPGQTASWLSSFLQ